MVRPPSSHPTLPEEDEFVYSTADDVLAFYKEIEWANPMEEKPAETMVAKHRMNNYSRAYFPRNIMRISEAEKGVREGNGYNIPFYRNEFKRVLLWHLSQFHEVCLY